MRGLRRPAGAGSAAKLRTVGLALVLALGAALRLYGLNWDGGQWLQPDERQIYFITLGLGWPHSLAEALGPASPLNPGSFAYGSLVFYLLRLFAAALAPLWAAVRDPDNLHLAGRLLATLLDLGTIALTYGLALGVWQSAPEGPKPSPRGRMPGRRWGALAAAALVSVAVLSIQTAHFYTADVLLTFLVVLALNLAAGVSRHPGPARVIALGAVVGLALATKVSSAPLLVVVVVAIWLGTHRRSEGFSPLVAVLEPLALSLVATAVAFVVVQPYAVIDWPTFLADTLRESQIAWGRLDVPYTRQYAGTLPYLYPIWQTALWGLGLPLGLAAWAGFGALLVRWLRRGNPTDSLLLSWAGPYLALTGLLYAKPLRYMLPLVPVLCLLAVDALFRLRWPRLRVAAYGVVGLGSLAYALVFASMYAAPHPWIAASAWIYRQVPAGSTLAVEAWDTALPLPLALDGSYRRIEEYPIQTLALYAEPDDAAKWQALAEELAGSDYVVVASRRVYGSVTRLPDRYPIASRYYEELFAGDLGFELAGQFTRGPAWLNPPVPPLPNAAPAVFRPDESYSVYDHPRALVFRNTGHLSPDELVRRLDAP